jgi:hypothetical protein
MYWYENSKDSISVEHMNSELQQAQLELINAHCATHQLRLHYSAEDLARFGRRDVLRKSAEAASALHAFYSVVQSRVPQSLQSAPPPEPSAEQIAQAVGWLSQYLQRQRERYLPVAGTLSPQHQAMLRPFFSLELLERVRILELQGARVDIPEFFAEIRAAGFEPPEISHMDSLTFPDVVVFNQQITLRALFHALVHLVQIEVLGLDRYAELWVQSFIKTRTHFTVPLEVHAFSLASKFLSPLAEKFSVEERVLCWRNEGRY